MSLKKRFGLVILLLIVVALAYLLLMPVPIAPAAWTPPAAPALTGQYAQNTRLSPVQKLSLGDGHKPEDVALDAEGKIYAGFEDGRIMVLQPDGTQPRVFAETQRSSTRIGLRSRRKSDRSGCDQGIVVQSIKPAK